MWITCVTTDGIRVNNEEKVTHRGRFFAVLLIGVLNSYVYLPMQKLLKIRPRRSSEVN